MSLLTRQQWPGNIRELEAFIRRSVLDGNKNYGLEYLDGDATLKAGLAEGVADVVCQTEIDAIRTALAQTNWNRRKAAKMLGLSYSSVRRRIAKYNLQTVDHEPGS